MSDFVRRIEFQGESVDIRLHHRAERLVNPAVSLDTIEAGESAGDQGNAEVASTVAGAGVPRVQMALVLDLESLRFEDLGQTLADPFGPVDHGSTSLKGLTTDRA